MEPIEVDRTLSRARARARHTFAMLAMVETDPDTREYLAQSVRAVDGIAPAREATAHGFRLSESRILRGIRFHPLTRHAFLWRWKLGAFDPSSDPKEPTTEAYLFQPRACGERMRKLDPGSVADTFTGQGYTKGRLDYLADRLAALAAESGDAQAMARAAAAAAAALEASKLRRKPKRKARKCHKPTADMVRAMHARAREQAS
jgi:hypothetical protein